MLQLEDNIIGMLENSFSQYANQIAYTCMKQDITYAELDSFSDDIAAWLLEHPSLSQGDRVAIQLPNLLQYPIAALGILKAGMVLVNLNPFYTSSEIEHQLNDSGAKVLFVFANTASSTARIINNTAVATVVVTQLADMHGGLQRTLTNTYLRYIKRTPQFHFTAGISFREVLKQGEMNKKKEDYSRHSKLIADHSFEQLAILQYTGGTTGVSKGAMLSERNLLSNMHQLKDQLGENCPRSGSIVVAPLPLYHIYAFTANLLFGLHGGMHNILIPNPKDISKLISSIKDYKINVFVGINTLYKVLCKDSNFSKLDFSELTTSTSAGMALSPIVAKQWFDLTGCKIMEGYGLTETSPIISINSDPAQHEGSVGQASKGTQIKIIDAAGNELANNKPGEIFVKGPQVMKGYWQKEEETKEMIDADGWLRTGDIGILDDNGYLRIVDRVKDIIIVSGFNVYPKEIEECICQHPEVVEAVAIGIADDDVSEKVKLVLVTSNPSLDQQAVIAFCRENLAAYKVPKEVEFRDYLPKSPVGKVLRRELKT